MGTKKRTKEEMNLITAVEQVVKLSKETHLSDDIFKKAAKPLKYISEKQEITMKQSVMLALFVEFFFSRYNISLSDIAEKFDCSSSTILRLMNDIDGLEQRGIVYCARDGQHIHYRLPMEVIDAFRKDEKFVPKRHVNITCIELFLVLQDIFSMRTREGLSFELTKIRVKGLLDDNQHLVFVQKLRSFGFNEGEELLLVYISHLFVNHNDDSIGFHDLSPLFDERSEWCLTKTSLSHGSHPLLKSKMIEHNNDDGFVNKESFRMTWQAKEALFPELKLSSMNQEILRNNLIKHEEITAKELFYDQEITLQIEDLKHILEEEHYKAIRQQMTDKGFRCGLTCLFYGAPGTGKTETAMQLARLTGRDVIQVDIPQIKSMWVGESEKNIKAVFEQYRAKAEKLGIMPILLFNEADAIINKRKEGAEHAVDKMENSIQNIILQEMETFDGILIATTNFAQNLDKAFERRFLYKIKFNKPTLEARKSIWHEMLPSLGDEEIHTLATQYDFSGGQIENIARHHTIDTILHGESAHTIKKLMEHCDNERLEKRERKKVGF
ncbi:MAG: AAA family ATPase [Paludibacteraceae bacterium]|nr:AAA family ATPase [Paludibacteraceae bacterium]